MYVRLRRSPSLRDRATALRALSSLLHAGLTLPSALQEWSGALTGDLSIVVRDVGRLVALGASPIDAIDAAASAFGEDIGALRGAIQLHLESGADPIPILERAAGVLESRADSESSGRAAVAGARLSGWMVGGLPLISLPLLPMARGPLFDPIGRTVLVLGLAFTAIGMAWLAQLVPRSRPGDDALALLSDHIAAALEAGASLHAALELASRHAAADLTVALGEARRRVELGQPWGLALQAASPSFVPLVATLDRAERLGAPPASALSSLSRARRAAAERAFEREVRRAPVLMVLPLVLCVLPAFGLIAIVPFLRGISFT